MHTDALKGRELLRSVYRSNGSLDPMRALAGFAHDEDGRWTELQGKLPVQLTQQASLVNQLFDDISEDVAPLRLAQPPRQERWHGRPRSGRRLDRLPRRHPGGRFRRRAGRPGPGRRSDRRQAPRWQRGPGQPRHRRDGRQRQGRRSAEHPAHQRPGRRQRAGRRPHQRAHRCQARAERRRGPAAGAPAVRHTRCPGRGPSGRRGAPSGSGPAARAADPRRLTSGLRGPAECDIRRAPAVSPALPPAVPPAVPEGRGQKKTERRCTSSW